MLRKKGPVHGSLFYMPFRILALLILCDIEYCLIIINDFQVLSSYTLSLLTV